MKRFIYVIYVIIIAFTVCFAVAGCQDTDTAAEIENHPSNADNANASISNTDNKYNTSEVKAMNYTANMSNDVWNSVNMEYGRFKTKDEFITETEYYIKVISEFVCKEDWVDEYANRYSLCHIEYLLTDELSRVEPGNGSQIYVYLKKDYFEHDLAPIALVLTRIIVPFDNSSPSLSGGLASYCQDKFGKNPSVFNWGIEPHSFSNLFLNSKPEEFEQIFPLIGTKDSQQNGYTNNEFRQMFYVLSHSFTAYLIDTFGIESFMSLYESSNLTEDYNIIYGKPFDDIKSDWRGIVESSAITLDEYQIHMTELLTNHNYPTE